MGSAAPLNRLTLVANSVTDDLGFVALADLSRVLLETGNIHDTRIIGGQMVMLRSATMRRQVSRRHQPRRLERSGDGGSGEARAGRRS